MIDQSQLKIYCNEQQENAENTAFSKMLTNGTVTNTLYKQYTWQMYMITDAIESRLDLGLGDLERRQKFAHDCAMSGPSEVNTLLSTSTYVSELRGMTTDQLRGHVYAHYIGLLTTCKAMSKVLKLPATHLKFQNVKAGVDHINSIILADIQQSDADQAVRAYERMIDIYNEITAAV